jgi:hypothetical protein
VNSAFNDPLGQKPAVANVLTSTPDPPSPLLRRGKFSSKCQYGKKLAQVMNAYKRLQNFVPCSVSVMQETKYSDCFIMSIHRRNFWYYEDMSSRASSSVHLSNPASYYIIVTLRLTGPLRFAFKCLYPISFELYCIYFKRYV